MPSIKEVERGYKQKAIMIRMSEDDMNAIKRQAERYTKGNVSDWVRYATKLDPPK